MLENMHKDFNVSAKAVDYDDIKLNYKSLRGNGGIGVFWKNTIDNAVKIKSDEGVVVYKLLQSTMYRQCYA